MNSSATAPEYLTASPCKGVGSILHGRLLGQETQESGAGDYSRASFTRNCAPVLGLSNRIQVADGSPVGVEHAALDIGHAKLGAKLTDQRLHPSQ